MISAIRKLKDNKILIILSYNFLKQSKQQMTEIFLTSDMHQIVCSAVC